MEKQKAELVNTKTGEIVEPQKAVMVFGSSETEGIVSKATEVANRLVDIVEKAKLYSMIKDKKYVKAEGWTAMCAMLGVFPETEYCRKIERDDEIAYEARILLRHISGALVGAGEAICSSKERNWGGRDEYTVKSMAQTRATGKACRLSFSWIMAMAGYEPTPSEEMINETPARTIEMPRPKPKADVVHVVAEPVQPTLQEAALHAQAPTEIEFGAPKDGGVAPTTSKFFAALHKVAREHKVPAEKLKGIIRGTYKKESSKDLTDAETVALIKLIESKAV